MKKQLALILALAATVAACKKQNLPSVFELSVQLTSEGKAYAASGIDIKISDGANDFILASDAEGKAIFTLPAAAYSIEASTINGKSALNGRSSLVLENANRSINLNLVKSAISSIVIKELYSGGCMNNDASKSYTDDAYITVYNNSDTEYDASDLVFGVLGPANAQGDNQYMVNGELKYENTGWIPAYSAIWWFTTPVKIPAYSQITVACFGAIDHSKTVSASVNLSKSEYYWMANNDIQDIYDHGKYQVAETIAQTNFMSTKPFSQSNAWILSVSSPAAFIASMPKAEVEALSADTQGYDTTLGSSSVCVHFPATKVLDGIEVWPESDLDESIIRFPLNCNMGYVALANQTGHTLYRNVDKAATEAIPGNSAKLVKGYADDPSGIDAEASIKAGAKIVYLNTNNSARDFHERKVSALK